MNDLEYEIEIFFPEIVLLEMISHHEQKLIKELQELKKINEELRNFEDINISGFINFNHENYCEELKKKYFKDLKIIKIPSNKSFLFDHILEMSLKKKPPFIDGKSDKGVKDSILFLSLLKFGESKIYDKYVLFSNSKGFINNKNELKSQFSNHVNKFRKFDGYDKLEIINNQNIMNYIDEEFKLFKLLRDYLENNFFNYLYEKYENANYIELGTLDEYEILSSEIIGSDTVIHQISDVEFEVEIFISVKYYLPKEYDEFDDLFEILNNRETDYVTQHEIYIFEKIKGGWYSDLSSRRYDIIFY